jgi:hypothetical protein
MLWERGGKAQQEAVDLAKLCVNSGLTPEERYYRGLAYYLLGKNNSADDDFEESRKSPVVNTRKS